MRVLSTALIGFGKIAQGYASDLAMSQHYLYSTHAQVLRDHPRYSWRAVVDPDVSALSAAKDYWKVEDVATSPFNLSCLSDIEVIILATPPDQRLHLLDSFPSLRAVLVEKPLGISSEDSQAFVEYCNSRGILVQVNLWRRTDQFFNLLANGELSNLVGRIQAINAVYGNGILNNGVHMVDFARMLFGEIKLIQRLTQGFIEGPIPGDLNPSFVLYTDASQPIVFQPLSFNSYRENGMTVWGDSGKLSILNEGLVIQHFPACDNRAMTGEKEVPSDQPHIFPTTVGNSLFHMYSNLAAALDDENPTILKSPADSAIRSSYVISTLLKQPGNGSRHELSW